MSVDWQTIITPENIQTLEGAVQQTISVIQDIIGFFSGVPKTQKTIETGARLVQSSNPLIRALGLFWYKAGTLGIVDSSAPDIAAYFKPAFDYTIQTLNIPFAAPDWYALSQVIGEGQPASVFDQAYNASNRATPMFVTQQAFNIQNPQDSYPQKLVDVYDLYIPSFRNPPVPVQPGQPGNGGGGGGGGQGGGGQGGGGQIDQACCDAIVSALNNIASLSSSNTDNLANAVDQRIDSLIAGVAPPVNTIAAAVTGLMQSAGAGASGLAQALANVGNLLSQTVTDATGQEVNAIQAATQALVKALGSIDADSENSLAGVARAMQNVADCCNKAFSGAQIEDHRALQKATALIRQLQTDGLLPNEYAQILSS